MSKERIITNFLKIVNTDEWAPNIEDKGWRQGRYSEIKDIKYSITKDTINKVKRYTDSFIYSESNRSPNIVKYYLVTDGKIRKIGLTDQTVKKAMIGQLIRYLKNEQSVFEHFPKIENVEFSLLLCTKRSEDDVKKTIKYLQKKHHITRSYSDVYRIRCRSIMDELNPDINSEKAYIFKIKNRTENKCFIGASKNTSDKDKIIRSVSKSDPDMHRDLFVLKHELSFRFIKEFEYKIDTELLIELDHIAEKYCSIGQYNRFRYVKKKYDEEKLFLDINRELSIKNLPDTYSYEKTNGFIYVVRNRINSKKFIGVGRETLKEIVNDVYKGKISKKLYDDIKNYPYHDFEYEIVKFNKDKTIDPHIEQGRMIERYKTDETGYN